MLNSTIRLHERHTRTIGFAFLLSTYFLIVSLPTLAGGWTPEPDESKPLEYASASTVETQEPDSVTDVLVDTITPERAAPSLKQQRIDIYASDKVATFVYERDASVISVTDGRLSAGIMIAEERDTVFQGSMLLDAKPGILPNVRLSFGSRAYVALLGIENNDAFGMALGTEAAYVLPIKGLPLELSAGLFYAPDIFAFGQADRIFDWNIDIALPLRKSFTVYTGFRYLQFDTRPGDREVDNNVHVGVRWFR